MSELVCVCVCVCVCSKRHMKTKVPRTHESHNMGLSSTFNPPVESFL